jgi:hypothetical protein
MRQIILNLMEVSLVYYEANNFKLNLIYNKRLTFMYQK